MLLAADSALNALPHWMLGLLLGLQLVSLADKAGDARLASISSNPYNRRSSRRESENLMLIRRTFIVVAFLLTLTAASTYVNAQQPQIPTLQVCNQTRATGQALVRINRRADVNSNGSFNVTIDLRCDPQQNTPFPAGTFRLLNISMSDSIVQGNITSTTIEQVTTTGKHTPTIYLNGRCQAQNVSGCRFWAMIADNKPANGQGTPDIVSFLVFNSSGQRIAYGTGPVLQGDIDVQPTPN
jgi:hypothetical protein